MDMPNILGLVTDGGGPTSHTAILARAHEIPSVVGLRFAEARVGAGDVIVVDGATGLVIIRPTESTLEYYKKEKARQDAERRAIAGGARDADSATIDGHEIATLVNIELPIEADSSLKQKCKGVGLFRTEFLFMNRPNLPSEEEQYGAYKRVLEVMNPLPVTIRTLDMGGDKIVTHVNREEETNPQLGWRSIRLCLDRPDIFKAQLRALYRASVHGNLQLMFPLVSGLDEFRQAKSMVEEVQEDLRARGISFDAKVKVGTMIEVPSAVAVASHLAEECAFFSIGTNDLIQYCLAVDRANDRTAHLYQPSHPGVLRLIKQTIEAAAKANIPCTICGEMAGDPLFTEVLIGMGLKNFSMSAVSFPVVRATLSRIKLTMARRFASKVLKMGSNSAVASAVAQRYEALSAQIRYERTEAAATVSTRPAQKE